VSDKSKTANNIRVGVLLNNRPIILLHLLFC